VQALDEGRDERVTRTESIDDLDRVAWYVDLATFVIEKDAALAPLQDECRYAERQQRAGLSRGSFDLLFVADDDVGMSGRGAGKLAVLIGSVPERRSPVEIEDRRAPVRRQRSERRLAARRLRETGAGGEEVARRGDLVRVEVRWRELPVRCGR